MCVCVCVRERERERHTHTHTHTQTHTQTEGMCAPIQKFTCYQTHHADRDNFCCRAEGDSVEVDESLFEDMGDLDLDEADDDEDDPDYVP